MKLFGQVALIWMGALTVTAQASQINPDGQAPGQIRGVIATTDGHAVASARVNIVNPQSDIQRKATSDAEGRFTFSDLPPGAYEIRVEMEGFERLTQKVEVKAGVITSLSLKLTLVPFTETITVTATKTEQKLGEVPVPVSVLTRDDIKRSAALTVDDLLKQVSSFSLFRRTSSLVSHPTTQGVSLRGIGASGVSRTLVLLDGVPHNDHFGNWVYWSNTRQRQNVGRARVRGIDSEIEYRINPRWKTWGRYLFDEATIEDFSAEPAIEGNLIPQVPQHRAGLGLDYVNPARVNLSLQGRFESLRFDDDLNQFKLGSFFVTDLTVSRPLGQIWEAFLSVENLFNRRYAVQATPVELLGTPIIVSAGVRLNISHR